MCTKATIVLTCQQLRRSWQAPARVRGHRCSVRVYSIVNLVLILSSYGDDIYNALTGKTDPDQVCTAIKLCTAAAPAPVVVIEAPAEEACTICEALLTDVAKFIPATYTEADLKALLDKG